MDGILGHGRNRTDVFTGLRSVSWTCWHWRHVPQCLQCIISQSVQALASKRCGINAAPRLSAAVAAPRVAPVCTAIEAKHKLKTRSAMAKRFKVTASGKVIRRHAGKQHLNEKKRPKQLKRLSKEESVFVGDVRFCLIHTDGP